MPAPGKKIALLIGNDSYSDARLKPLVVPAEDVRGLRAVLEDPAIGSFDEVRELLNADRTAVAGEIERLFAEAERDDLVLLYFSGHGVLDRLGRLYLALAETNIDRPVATALRSDDVRDLLEQGRCRRQVLILDCCYSGAFARAAKDAGQAPAVTPQTFDTQGEGRVALLSSTATQRSFEGNQVLGETEHSLFTHYLVEGLQTGAAAAGRELVTEEDLFQYAYDRVRAAGAGMTPQRWVGRQHGRLVIARNRAWTPNPEDLLPPDLLKDLAADQYRTRLGAVHELTDLMRQPPNEEAVRAVLEDRLRVERDYKVRDLINRVLTPGTPATPTVPDPQLKPQPKPKSAPEPLSVFRDRLKDGTEGPEMVVIPAGEFWMGSPEDEPERYDDEKRHQVKIARPFAIGKHEATFDQYDRFAKATGRELPGDAGWGRGERPVINVSWDDAAAYAEWLAEQTGKRYRLPTEAEWEYAARAGTETPFYTGRCILTDQANYDGNSNYNGCGAKTGVYREKTLPVGSLAPNPWGLFDMAGNVWEWTCSEYAEYGAGKEGKCIRKNDANDGPGGPGWLVGQLAEVAAFRLPLRVRAVEPGRRPRFPPRPGPLAFLFPLFPFYTESVVTEGSGIHS